MSISGETLGAPTLAPASRGRSGKQFAGLAVAAACVVAPLSNSPAEAEGWGRAWLGEFGALALNPSSQVSDFQNTLAQTPLINDTPQADPDADYGVFQNEARVFNQRPVAQTRSLRLWIGNSTFYDDDAASHDSDYFHVTTQTLEQEPMTLGVGFQVPLGEGMDLSGALLRGEADGHSNLGRDNRVTLRAAFRF
ncbi:hypothetical protein TRM7557_03615 [Tritonibacter multivorans]|uniref:Uncharacterized protein n=1 Tax=Tritonibacter multivorans TaxID=928856 RepID=A0A0P1GID6_9RHOB|nr:hypothetical protein [Tritonibacter multivorans]MDA7420332.1 hypothetical protein [Tritonibacter multivorans]CUH81800.1 hypothetical protein TRM7557_03615 [Tritonibacter multivorans]SFC43974.1 hypothetical protein SAMN04488049_102452 [Tritonibacter multivorans]